MTGIDPGDRLASRSARMAVYERLLAELDANNQQLSNQISEIDLTDPEDARVLMPEQGADILAHFGQDRFLERYQRYKAHISEWRQQYPKLAAVDLRFDQQVVLEMAHGTSRGAHPRREARTRCQQSKAIAGEAAKTPIADSTVASIQANSESFIEAGCNRAGQVEARLSKSARQKRRQKIQQPDKLRKREAAPQKTRPTKKEGNAPPSCRSKSRRSKPSTSSGRGPEGSERP